MRLFLKIVIAIVAGFVLFNPAQAEDSRYVALVDVATIKTSLDVYHAKQWSDSRRYERRSEVDNIYINKNQEMYLVAFDKKQEALKQVRSAKYEAYLQWLDAREMFDFDRVVEIEKATPEFQWYRAEVDKIDLARDQNFAALEAEKELIYAEIDAVHEAEVEMIDQAYAKNKSSQ